MNNQKIVTLVQSGISYTLGGGMGSWAQSREWNPKEGEVRFIGGVLMHCYTTTYIMWFRRAANWIPVDGSFNTYENLRTWIDK